MRAAIVSRFDMPPSYGDFPEPQASEGEVVIRVQAAPMSPIVKRLAAGRYYTRAAESKFVQGIDGVGISLDEQRVYRLFALSPFGSMAPQVLISVCSVVPVPDSVGDARAAAAITAGLSSWAALTQRAGYSRRPRRIGAHGWGTVSAVYSAGLRCWRTNLCFCVVPSQPGP